MVVNRSLVFLVVAIVCFAIGLCVAVNLLSGGNLDGWLFAGLLAFALAHLP